MRTPRSLPLLLLLVGCGPSVQSAVYAPNAPGSRPDDAPVRIYQSTRPTCAFEEIGLVRVRPRNSTHSLEDLLTAMRKRARAMGGDAIIGLSATETPDGAVLVPSPSVSVASISSSPLYTGTVVHFTDPACAE